jgi:D-serine deaminase-like pyridoxal phosphate-dependent protein
MDDEPKNKTHAAMSQVVKLEEELEASGVATHDSEALAAAKTQLYAWIDTVTATVVSPGLGRVTLIHANGSKSSITSPELPFAMSKKVEH